jgi:transposase
MNEATRNEIIRRWHGGASQRAIARALRISRNSVARILARHQRDRTEGPPHPDLPAEPTRRPSKLDAYDDAMRELVGRYPDITATRMFEELRDRGFSGGYTIVRQRLRALCPRPSPEPVIRFETAPGAQAQMDYALYDLDFTRDGRRRVNLFSYLLGYSRRQYLRFVPAQDFETTVREHIRAFTHLGGAAATCLYDNMKVVVRGYEDGEPVYNPRFLAFATHYGFRPWACRPRRAQTKGKIERPFRFVETSLLNGRTFRDLDHLNEVTAWWLADVADVRVHRTTQRRPVDLHAEEQPHLIELPAQPYDVSEVVYRTVTVEGFVAYRQNLYSVPWTHIGRVLAVRITQDELIVYGPHVEEIARHPLLPRTTTGQRREQKAHRPDRTDRPRHAILHERFVELGPVAVRFFEGLVQGHRYGKDQAAKVLALLSTYRRDDLVAALTRAVRFQAFSLQAVERILAAGARPKTPLESLADTEQRHLEPRLTAEPVPPRGPDEYQDLFPPEASEDGEPIQPPTEPPRDPA